MGGGSPRHDLWFLITVRPDTTSTDGSASSRRGLAAAPEKGAPVYLWMVTLRAADHAELPR